MSNLEIFTNYQSNCEQSALDFPLPLTEKYRPREISEFIGLDKPKKLCANIAANPRVIDLIFVGPSGTGKTTLALALAAMMPAEIHHIPSSECNIENLSNVRRACQYVPITGCKMHILLVDEADRMTPAAQLACLSYLDSTNHPPCTANF